MKSHGSTGNCLLCKRVKTGADGVTKEKPLHSSDFSRDWRVQQKKKRS